MPELVGAAEGICMITVNSSWVKFFHVIYLAAWLVTDLTPGYDSETYKYMFLMVPIAISFYLLWMNGFKIRKDTYVFGWHLMYVVFALLVTLFAVYFSDAYILELKDIGRIMFPLMYAFLLLNTDSTENKDFYVDTIFLACIIDMLIRFAPILTIENILSIDFFDSYSPFELHLSQDVAVYVFYYYMRKKRGRTALTLIFCYLTLKRIHFLFAFLLVVFGSIIRRVKITDRKIAFFALVFCISPAIMDFLISPGFINWFDSTFGISYAKFTMSRLDQMILLLNYEGSLLGLQVVNQYLNKIGYKIHCHSDLIRIYLETTIVGLSLYVGAWFNMLKVRRAGCVLFAMLMTFSGMFGTINMTQIHAYFVLAFICCVDFEAAAREDELGRTRRRMRLACS